MGIEFMGKSEKYPNTIKAHVRLEMAKYDPDMQNQLVEYLFKVNCILKKITPPHPPPTHIWHSNIKECWAYHKQDSCNTLYNFGSLLQAYFTDGSLLENNDLLDLAHSVGLSWSEAETAILDNAKQ